MGKRQEKKTPSKNGNGKKTERRKDFKTTPLIKWG